MSNNGDEKSVPSSTPSISAESLSPSIAATQRITQLSFSSPLPPPELLMKYEQVQPGLIEQVVQMTVAQGNHRRELEMKKLDSDIKHLERRDFEGKLGQIFAFIIAMTAILAGSYMILEGNVKSGIFMTLTGIGTIVSSFINGRKKENT